MLFKYNNKKGIIKVNKGLAKATMMMVFVGFVLLSCWLVFGGTITIFNDSLSAVNITFASSGYDSTSANITFSSNVTSVTSATMNINGYNSTFYPDSISVDIGANGIIDWYVFDNITIYDKKYYNHNYFNTHELVNVDNIHFLSISGNSDNIIANIFKVNTTDWTTTNYSSLDFGTSGTGISAVQIDTEHYLVSYSGGNVVLEVNTTDWSISNYTILSNCGSLASNSKSLSKIDATHYLSTYDKDVVLEVNTTDWSISNYTPTSLSKEYNSIIKMNETHYLSTYSISDVGYARVLEVNTTDWSISNYSIYNFSTMHRNSKLEKIDSEHYLNIYRGQDSDGYASILYVNTTNNNVITKLSDLEFDTTYGANFGIEKIDTNFYILTWGGGSDNQFFASVIEVKDDWSIVKYDTITIGYINGAYGPIPGMEKIDENHYLVTYGESTSSSTIFILRVMKNLTESVTTSDFASELETYVHEICSSFPCNVPINMTSESAGIVELSGLSIQTKTTSSVTSRTIDPTTAYVTDTMHGNITVTDDDSGDTLTGYCQSYVNGTAYGSVQSLTVSNNTHTNICNISGSVIAKNGNITFEMWAGDGTTNTTKANTSTVTISNSFPTIPSLTSPSNDTNTSNTYMYIQFSSTDADSDTITYYLYADTNSDPSTLIYNGTNAYYNWTGLADNRYYFKVKAGDGTDNSSFSEIRTFLQDDTAPTFSAEALNDTTTESEQNVTFTFNVTDAGIGVDMCKGELRLEDNSRTNITGSLVGGVCTVSGNISQVGDYCFTPYANDTLGNYGKGTETCGVRVSTSWGNWYQDASETTIVNGTAYIMKNFTINNTLGSLSASGVITNFASEVRSGWTCNENETTISSSIEAGTISTFYPLNCTKADVIVVDDVSYIVTDGVVNVDTTEAGLLNTTVNNTDTIVSYTNVYLNLSSYLNNWTNTSSYEHTFSISSDSIEYKTVDLEQTLVTEYGYIPCVVEQEAETYRLYRCSWILTVADNLTASYNISDSVPSTRFNDWAERYDMTLKESDTTTGIIPTYTSTSVDYIINTTHGSSSLEKGDRTLYLRYKVPPIGGGGSTSGGGGGGGDAIVCGDGICQFGETKESCPEDCDVDFDVSRQYFQLLFKPEYTISEAFVLLNPSSNKIDVSLSIECVENDISCEWANFKYGEEKIKEMMVSLPVGSEDYPGRHTVYFDIDVPKDALNNKYSFNLVVSSGQKRIIVPVNLQKSGIGVYQFDIIAFLDEPMITLEKPIGAIKEIKWKVGILFAFVIGLVYFMKNGKSKKYKNEIFKV